MVRRKAAARSTSSRRSSTTSKSERRSATHSNKTRTLVNRRRKPGYRALQEIKYYQKSTKLLIPKAPFARLIRELILEVHPRLDEFKIQRIALEALQESAEMYLVQFFEDAVLLSFHAKRVTLFPHDMRLVRRMRGRHDIVNR